MYHYNDHNECLVCQRWSSSNFILDALRGSLLKRATIHMLRTTE